MLSQVRMKLQFEQFQGVRITNRGSHENASHVQFWTTWHVYSNSGDAPLALRRRCNQESTQEAGYAKRSCFFPAGT